MLHSNSGARTRTFRAVAAAALLTISTFANASVVVGSAAVNRTYHDGFANFVIALPGSSFAADGSFDKWSVYAHSAGSLGLLILNGSTTAPKVVHSIFQTGVVAGLNTFDLASAFSVSAGDYLGIWMNNTAKVDYDLSGVNTPYSPNGFYTSIPLAGATLNTPSSQGATNRFYSINVNFTETTATVSSPGTMALVGLSLIGLAAMRRRA